MLFSTRPGGNRADENCGASTEELLRARVERLEGLLEQQACRLARCQHMLTTIQSSSAYQFLCRSIPRLLRCAPPGTRRRRLAVRLFRMWAARKVHTSPNSGRPHGTASPAAYVTFNLERTSAAELQAQYEAENPTVSLLMRTADQSAAAIELTIRSLQAQSSPRWQLCIVQATLDDPETLAADARSSPVDSRIYRVRSPYGATCAADWNVALQSAAGEFVAVIEPDDALSPTAVSEINRALRQRPAVDVIYSDEDWIDATGRRLAPHFKPDWSPDLLRSTNYLGRLLFVRRELMERLGGFREEFNGAEEYDVALRATESAETIIHIPQVLYHRRRRGTEFGIAGAPACSTSARRVLQEHLVRCGVHGVVRDGLVPHSFQVRYQIARQPLVSIIIPNRDEAAVLARCLASIRESTYRQFEVLIVENGSRSRQTMDLYAGFAGEPRVRILNWRHAFNYSAVNNWAAAQARGDVLLLLNNDTEAINADWLERMLEHVLRPEVGAVGAKLYFSDGTIQHGGVIIGIGPVAGHSHRFVPGDSPGYANRLATVQNFSAVTAACLMVRKDVFESVGGLDEDFPLALNDVDFCLRLRKAGYQIVWTPFAELYHHESRTRGHDDTPEKQNRALRELTHFYRRWHELLLTGDPFYNPNLTSSLEDFSLSPLDSSANRAA